jgi:cytochrome d ubiquinol oxidase subunit II
MADPAQLLLADIWFVLLGLLLVLYVTLDGFDLGVGILSLFTRSAERHDVMMSSLGSVWDANETWLVVFGGALFGAFPVAYGLLLHSLYIPITLMLLALIFRGVAFEFREHSRNGERWTFAFGAGSLVAALTQGLALGAVLGGIPQQDYQFTGSVWHWVSLFSVLTAVGVVFGYVLLGATYLIIKTLGPLQQRCYRVARTAAWLTAGAGLAVSLWTPLRFDFVAERWFSWPNTLYLGSLPALAVLAFFLLLRSLRLRRERSPFVWSVIIFLASFAGLGVTLHPYLVPPDVRAVETAASSRTLIFMLTGIGILIPVMMIYNGYQYLVFRGKVKATDTGH